MYDINQIKNIFNELVQKIKQELDEQFQKGRIKGTDYATTYSSLMNQALVLAFDAPIKEAQTNLQKEQQELVKAQTDGQKAQTEAIKSKLQHEINLIDAQIDWHKAQTEALQTKLQYEIDLIKAQTNESTARKEEVKKEIEKINVEINRIMPKQVEKMDREIRSYDDILLQKLLQMQFNAFSMYWSSIGGLDDPNAMPDSLTKSKLDEIYNKLANRA